MTQIGIVGLGKMGGNMVKRLLGGGQRLSLGSPGRSSQTTVPTGTCTSSECPSAPVRLLPSP